MKKLSIILLLFSLYSTSVFSQFELTKDGLKVKDSDKDYLICEFTGKTQSEVYISVLKTLTLKYKSAKHVLSKVENETISIKGYESAYIGAEKMLGVYLFLYDLDYKINISFRDDKIKIDIPTIEFISEIGNNRKLTLSDSGMFKAPIFKKDKVKEEGAKQRIEDFFNTLVAEIKQGVESEKEDW